MEPDWEQQVWVGLGRLERDDVFVSLLSSAGCATCRHSAVVELLLHSESDSAVGSNPDTKQT